MKKGQAILAAVLVLIMGGMAGAVIYMTFVFPKNFAIWEKEARALSALEMRMVNISNFCTHSGRLFLPIFLLGFLASLVWLILRVMKKSTANNKT
ncbi:MAG: hypothetical protein ACYS3N_15280 [Planctomycetota bacterium]|jgi:type II secretory pathway component PulF